MRNLEAGDAVQRLGASPHLIIALGQENQVAAGEPRRRGLVLRLHRRARTRGRRTPAPTATT
ncbi:MAG: hypothetical protein K0R41_4654 [Geminicoccaceae bacterium]|nr:hypothetical protein [Geminicoccaceae bacterium]